MIARFLALLLIAVASRAASTLDELPVITRATATVYRGQAGDESIPLFIGTFIPPGEAGILTTHEVRYQTDLLLAATPEFPDGTVLPMALGDWYVLRMEVTNIQGPMFLAWINDPLAVFPGQPLFFDLQSSVVEFGVHYTNTWERDRAPIIWAFYPHSWTGEAGISWHNDVTVKTAEMLTAPEPSPFLLAVGGGSLLLLKRHHL